MATKPTDQKRGLTPDRLRWRCDPATVPYATTDEAEIAEGVIGQVRAIRALKMGIELAGPGYNIFVCGLAGSSRGGLIARMIEEIEPQTQLAPDRCYVHNFKAPDRPRLLALPRGQADSFKKEMQVGSIFCAGAFLKCSKANHFNGRRAAS